MAQLQVRNPFLLVQSVHQDFMAMLSIQALQVHLDVLHALLIPIATVDLLLAQPVQLAPLSSLLHLVVVPHLHQALVRSTHPSISLDLNQKAFLHLQVSSTRMA